MNPVRNYLCSATRIFYKAEKIIVGTTGVTKDLRKRFHEHQSGKSTWTKGRGPFTLVYYEACRDEQDARSRELHLKSGRGKRYLKSRLRRFLFRTG